MLSDEHQQRRSFWKWLLVLVVAVIMFFIDSFTSWGRPHTLVANAAAVPTKDYSQQIGVAHVAGNYHFTDQPFLLEGAQAIRQLGSKVIKVFLQHPAQKYHFNSDWPTTPNIVDVLRTDYFQQLLAMDFEVYVLQAHLDTIDSNYWKDGLSEQEYHLIAKNYYEATQYLLGTYRLAPPKQFYLEHWEADLYFELVMQPEQNDYTPEQLATAQQGLLDYFRARHEGVQLARQVIPDSNAQVFTSVELIYLGDYPGSWRLIDCLDEVAADAIAYSTGLDNGANAELLAQRLSLLRSKLGGRPFYIGELQVPEIDFEGKHPQAHALATLRMLDVSFANQAEFAVLWQIYDNEICTNADGCLTDRGFGLIRRDGSHTLLYQSLARALARQSYYQSKLHRPF